MRNASDAYRLADAENTPFPEVKALFDADPLALRWRVPGVWPIHKPSGPSSHGIVAKMRRILGVKRVGHAGTLDPLASGLLLVMAGNATRLFDRFQQYPKTYEASFRFGVRTDSQDITGQPLADWEGVSDRLPTRDAAEAALGAFRGEIEQTPPMFSALKKNGVPLYKLARKGESVERAPRQAMVHALTLNTLEGAEGTLTMRVASGFYVRTLVDDWGVELGCGATMTALRRTAIGPFALDAALAVEEAAALVADKKS